MINNPVVATTFGPVRGARSRGVLSFKGIPYGSSPAGENRFRATMPVAHWTKVLEATAFGPACPQMVGQDSSYFAGLCGAEAIDLETQANESCLALNVWTLDADNKRRPVMVWLHGGAFTGGSASKPMTDGSQLASRGAVVVSLNHRLGVLGFLELEKVLGSDFVDSGSVGMLDIVSALRWVQDNIDRFGGDPENVTIFGVSGGGYKVSTLLAMPVAVGLFHRAIIQSGPGSRLEAPDRAEERAAALLAELGITSKDTDRLFDLPAQLLLDAQTTLVQRAGGPVDGGLGFSPHVDSRIVEDHPGNAVARGVASNVPLMIGSNRHEFTRFFRDFSPLDDEAVLSSLHPTAGEAAAEILHTYRDAEPNATNRDLLALILSDQMTRVPSIRFAEQKATGGIAPVYMYLLSWESPAFDGLFKAAHTLETPLVFGNVSDHPLTADQPGSGAISDIMSSAWINFAIVGDPNHPGLPRWDPFTPQGRSTMVFDTVSHLVSDPHSEERSAWDGVRTGEEILV